MKQTRISILAALLVWVSVLFCQSDGQAAQRQEVGNGFSIVGQLTDLSIEQKNEFRDLFRQRLMHDVDRNSEKGFDIEFLGERQVKLSMPGATREEAEEVWNRLTTRIELAFRIVATSQGHATVIEAAKKMSEKRQSIVDQRSFVYAEDSINDKAAKNSRHNAIGQWVPIGKDDQPKEGHDFPLFKYLPNKYCLLRNHQTGELIDYDDSELATEFDNKLEAFTAWCNQNGHSNVDILVCLPMQERHDINGEHVLSAQKGMSEAGKPRVEFRLSPQGAKRMFSLTAAHKPESGRYHTLAFVLDGKLVFGGRINSAIRGAGVIEGNFSEREVDWMTAVFKSQLIEPPIKPDWISFDEIK